MIEKLFDLLQTRWDFFAKLLLEHISISMTAIAFAMVLGLIMGVLISEYRSSAKPTMAIVNFIYTIPSISLLGFLIPLSGIGNTTAIIALTVYALLPMVRNTHTGLTNVDPLLIEAATGMGSTRAQVLFKIKLPLAMPVIMAGIRNMAVMTIALAGIASFIGAGGLGVAIYRGITTNNKSMTAAIMLTALAGCGSDKNTTVHMATKPMTEQYILGCMTKALIEQETGLAVEITEGVGGGTSNIQPAMESGEFDFYPEYTGTGWNAVLKKDGSYDESMFDELQTGYEALGMTWAGMLGFNNTFGIAVTQETAERYSLETYSDLAAVAGELTFGAEYDFFEREDGYYALCDTYGLAFGDTMDLDIGLKYDAIGQHKIDVMNIFTTDGQLAAADIKVLKDDKGLYPSYVCGFVVRNEALAAHPELKKVFDMMENLITDAEMAEMNYQVETEGQEPEDVALAFLRTKGLLD